MNALKSHKFFWTVILLLFLCVLIPVEPLGAAIKPEEIVIIVNSRSADSMRIGKLYSRLRNVPSSHIISVDVPLNDSISRKRYERLIAGPVRKAITGLYNEGKEIRCIVTTYGIPLRVNMMKPLIYPEEKISKYSRLLKEKEKKLSVLKKERKKNREGKEKANRKIVNELNRSINKLEIEIRKFNIELVSLKGHDTAVAVDSELALLFAPGHQLSGWLPNPVFVFNRERYQNFIGRIFMVSRLDAPSAALYCGWYSHRKYVDAFEWVKGAVGYHVASSEAVSLHNPNAKFWVKSMIEKGVIASIGPVAEPYLTAFPPPSIFSPLLMSGEYSLAEVFAMTNPFLSWQMILVGDPLYNPFRKEPAFVIENPPLPPY